MATGKITNRTRSTIIAEHSEVASTWVKKIRGLLGRPELPPGRALVIPSLCPQVHTFFMSYAIDIIFVDREGAVVGLESLKPWRVSGLYPKANRVVELAEGMIQKSNTHQGDQLEF